MNGIGELCGSDCCLLGLLVSLSVSSGRTVGLGRGQ